MNIPKNILFSFGFTLLIWASAWFSIPIGPVPISLQSSAVFLAALLLPMRYALISVLLYIALGAAGLPVFAGGRSGLEALSGPTAGFIFGFVISVIIISYLTKDIRYHVRNKKNIDLYWQTARACIVGTVVLQSCGVIWGKIYTGEEWGIVYNMWVHPFYLNMVVKIFISVLAGVQVWKETSTHNKIY